MEVDYKHAYTFCMEHSSRVKMRSMVTARIFEII